LANTLSETVLRVEPEASAPLRRSSWTRWPKRILLFLVFLWLAGTAISFLIEHSRLHRKITARLESVFGRPVEVGRYDFTLWGWPTLAAESITVGEDPRFGQEYFLRADSLTVRLRWLGLLRGRLEFGTLLLDHPSLNLVRNAEGDWNLAEWLPRPFASTPGASSITIPVGPARPPSSPLRFTRVEVDSGRINFKRGDEKIPFAFTGVNGFLEPDGPGRWRFDLEAVPSRAAVVLQQAGTLHLSGHVGGTSSRLRPAAIDLSWTDASISDLLRLLRSYDYGVRGAFALALHAQTDADAWLVEGRSELRQIHRWDLPLRADNPALNLIAKMRWYPLDSGLDFEEATLEAPHSHARLRALLSWEHGQTSRTPQPPPFRVQIYSSAIDSSDLLAWLRAFHPGVADDVSVQGALAASGLIAGWPLRVENASVESAGGKNTRGENETAVLTAPGLRVPVHLGEISLRYDRGLDYLNPLALSFGATDGSLRLEASRKSGTNFLSALHLTGNLKQVRDLVATAAALGWNISRGWDLAGPVRCDLRWDAEQLAWPSQPLGTSMSAPIGPPVGTIDWGAEPTGGSLRAPFLNRPFEQIRAHADLKPDTRHVALTSAAAFGAHWTGTFDHRQADPEWQFALSADHLAAADFDRWLNPRWRQSFLDRMLPFLSPRSASIAIPENLRASGKITVDQFSVAPFAVHRLQGDVKLEGRHIEFANAKAQFYGGELDGSFDTTLAAPPAYHMRLDFSRVDLAALTAAAPGLANLFAGSASGNISIAARGANRSDLLASLECRGTARVNGAELRNLNLAESLRDAAPRPGTTSFRDASAAFTCGDGKVHFQELLLLGANAEFSGLGSIDFTHHLDLRLSVFAREAGVHNIRAASVPEETYLLTGTLAAPEFAGATTPAEQP
jgi:AsmA-like C-terminal region/AsmA family